MKELQEQESARADDEARRADAAEATASRLAFLGRRARQGTASPEELAELERLEDEAGAA
ncbi:MAG: hypothetical protein K2W96_16475 [Gemmataceae bacterium]|nr:hypothetical protein [Gemmataceae bacterium]